MPIRIELSTKLSFRAHALEIPLDLDNLEGAIRERTRSAVIDFLGEDIIAESERELTIEVHVELLAMTDPDGRNPIGIRRKDLEQQW